MCYSIWNTVGTRYGWVKWTEKHCLGGGKLFEDQEETNLENCVGEITENCFTKIQDHFEKSSNIICVRSPAKKTLQNPVFKKVDPNEWTVTFFSIYEMKESKAKKKKNYKAHNVWICCLKLVFIFVLRKKKLVMKRIKYCMISRSLSASKVVSFEANDGKIRSSCFVSFFD